MLDLQCSGNTLQWPVSQKIVSPLVILSREKTMVTKVISELHSLKLKSISRLKILPETGPRAFLLSKYANSLNC